MSKASWRILGFLRFKPDFGLKDENFGSVVSGGISRGSSGSGINFASWEAIDLTVSKVRPRCAKEFEMVRIKNCGTAKQRKLDAAGEVLLKGTVI